MQGLPRPLLFAVPAVLALAVAAYLVFGGGGGDDDSPGGGGTGTSAQACAAFANQAVQAYCESDAGGNLLDCTDFSTSNEATRFIQAHDPENENQLEETAGAFCPILAGGTGSQPPLTSPTNPADASATPESSPTATPQPTTYVVQSGDNPTLIAQSVGVPEDEIEAWVAEMLALNGVEANALQVGQELILPPFGGGGTTPANTGGPTGSTGGDTPPTATAQPAATNTPATAANTPTTVPTVAGQPTATATATPTITPTPNATSTPGATATVSATPSGQASFNIQETVVQAGSTINYEGSGFTPNSAITITLIYEDLEVGSETDTVGPTGAFSGSGEIPSEASQFPGTYTIRITDSQGRTASDSIIIQ